VVFEKEEWSLLNIDEALEKYCHSKLSEANNFLMLGTNPQDIPCLYAGKVRLRLRITTGVKDFFRYGMTTMI